MVNVDGRGRRFAATPQRRLSDPFLAPRLVVFVSFEEQRDFLFRLVIVDESR